MKFRMALAAVVAAGLAAASVGAVAQPIEGGWHRGGLELLRGVGLTDAQKDQIHQIVKSNRTQVAPILQRMQAVHEQLAGQLLGSASVTEEQLQPLVDQEQELRSELDAKRLAIALQVRGVLTPQQLAQAAALHQKLSELRKQEHALLGGFPNSTP